MDNWKSEFESVFNKHNSSDAVLNPALMWRDIGAEEEWSKEKAMAYRDYADERDEKNKKAQEQ